MTPNIDELRTTFSYNYQTGKLYRIRKNGLVEQAESIGSNGYARVGFKYARYGAHRVAWALVTGKWPDKDIDHKNGIRTDNRLCNLRHVDRSTNLENIKTAKTHNKSTGVLGAYISKKGVITSRIKAKGKDLYLGSFNSIDEAHSAYIKAKREHHQGALL